MAGLLKGVTDTGKSPTPEPELETPAVLRDLINETNALLSSRRHCRPGWKHCRRCHQGVCSFLLLFLPLFEADTKSITEHEADTSSPPL